ncbi:ATP-binding protein [Pelagibius sp. 7325]|uniref:ATP-binding protein n=1 Tax=Pelagibius sp. 7325 TaxID=3131994 RepID=UPI0030EBD850
MPTGFLSLTQARELLACRLCRRITLLVCLSILAVEMAFLLPSYLKRQEALYEHQETEALQITKAALGWYEKHSPAEILEQSWPAFAQVSVEGMAIYAEDGRLLAAAGRRPVLAPLARSGATERSLARGDDPTVRRSDGNSHEILWPPVVSGLPFTAVARLDTTAIERDLAAYVLRIAALILILSLIVSGVTVAVIGRSVLNPLLAIHRNLTAAHADPLNAEHYKLDIEADNEIGETVTALNALLSRLSDIRRKDLHAREKRFEDFAASSSDWFWEMDEELRFCFFSERYTAVTGVPESLLMGKTRRETGIPNVDPKVWQQQLEDLDAHRPFRNFVHPRQKPNGETVWLSINGNPWFDKDGTFRGYRGTGRDITDQVAIQKALLTAKEEAETANRTKSEFLANISHELRTPLNAIIGFSELMMAQQPGLGGNPKHQGYLEDIHSSGLHLLSLINDILDLSKIEAGADELDEEILNVGELAGTVMRVVRQRAETSGVRIACSAAAELPALRADERKLKQALLNLLVNAIKFTPEGGEVELHIRCGGDSGYVFEVRDNGIGMAPEDIPVALRQFGQIDSALNRKYEGTGLGLPLTKALIEMHGGSLELESRLGEGTTATLILPAWRIAASPDALRSATAV